MKQNEFAIAGHRGAMALEPENTMRSFRRAVELGVDEIELDVRLSRDGQLVIMHDATLERTTNQRGAIADHDWAELSKIDAGEGERIPLLKDVLDEFEDVGFQIEVKSPEATPAVLEAVAARSRRSGTIHITSFDTDAIACALTPKRHWRVGLICGKGDAAKAARGMRMDVDQLLLRWDLIGALDTARFVEEGGLLSVWPGNTIGDVQRAIQEGYVGTTADDPRIALAVRAELV